MDSIKKTYLVSMIGAFGYEVQIEAVSEEEARELATCPRGPFTWEEVENIEVEEVKND